MMTKLRLLIADDEAPLRDWLRRLLAEGAPDAEIVAEAGDGAEALAAIERLHPDAAFLDIRMPGLSGLEVAARAAGKCSVVFVTAYDEFAVAAFERAAVDYLLKPVTAERLAMTMQRLREAVPLHEEAYAAQLRELLAHLHPVQPAPALRWLRIGSGDTIQFVDVESVDYFEAADKYTLVWVGNQEHLVRKSLRELETELDQEQFWRIHRGYIVRVAAIESVRRDLMGRLWLHLKSGAPPLPVSRSCAHLFNRM